MAFGVVSRVSGGHGNRAKFIHGKFEQQIFIDLCPDGFQTVNGDTCENSEAHTFERIATEKFTSLLCYTVAFILSTGVAAAFPFSGFV